jgi:hypothetical protein
MPTAKGRASGSPAGPSRPFENQNSSISGRVQRGTADAFGRLVFYELLNILQMPDSVRHNNGNPEKENECGSA